MKTLTFIGDNHLERVSDWIGPYLKNKILVVYDQKIKKAAKDLCRALAELDLDVKTYPLIVREEIKGIGTADAMYTFLIRNRFARDSLLISIGGGALSDLCGFVASTYLRGIDWINIPTTILAQVDAAIGGKTAINHPLGKNLIGTFYHPKAIICPVALLSTLSKRARISGLAEVIKYGLILDPALYRSCEKYWENYVKLDEELIRKAITKCLKLKTGIVEHDEKDSKGLRRILNFGHTLAHAFEAATDYKVFQHGEAVIIGMRIALMLSTLKGYLDPNLRERIDIFLKSIPQPKCRPIPLNTLIEFTLRDKKVKQGTVEYVLLEKIGQPVLDFASTDLVKEAIKELTLPQVK